MASSGRDKWKKYFFGHAELQTKIKSKPNQAVALFDVKIPTKRIDSLMDGQDIIVYPDKEYSSKYRISYKKGQTKIYGLVPEANVAKPIKGKSDELKNDLNRITASNFIEKGKDVKFKYSEKLIDCKEFKTVKEVSDSMLYGMKNTKGVNEEIYTIFSKYFKNGMKKIEWNSDISEIELNKYGIYFGEILIGAYALNGKTNEVFTPNIIKTKVKRFLIPTDPSFSGVDSFIELTNGTVIPISSKFGIGAKASIFSNILAKGIQYEKKLKPSVLKNIVLAAKEINATALEAKRKSKEIVYNYGIRYILKLPKAKIPNTYQVFLDAKANKKTKEVSMVLNEITKYKSIDAAVKMKLPKSMTAFFCRTIASQLNADKTSITQMKEILSGKNYWQANLNISEWKKGNVKFAITNSGNAELRIIGNKAPIDDIEAKQGLVNYELKMQ